MQEHRLALPVGFQIEHFRIEAVLGKGGFGITYLAVDPRLAKKVAIKELLPDSIATRAEGATVVPQAPGMKESWEWARERFLEEARTLAAFSHPALVSVHRLIEANGTAYIIMDYVEGESYEARLQRIGNEPDQASLMKVIGPILSGLEEVHAHGLLHRDIKPENILINKRGQPVLIDFGSARESVGKTMTMTSIVTHGYSPIEQYQTQGLMGPWTDIYALGAVMYRAITGRKPPVATDRVLQDVLRPLAEEGGSKDFDRDFLKAVQSSLELRPESRPQHIGAWSKNLHGGSPISLPSTHGQQSSFDKGSDSDQALKMRGGAGARTSDEIQHILRRWGPWAAAAVGVILFLGLLASGRDPSSQPTSPSGPKLVDLPEDAPAETKESAFKMSLQRADQGSAEAQLDVGQAYHFGIGTSQDLAKAADWYRRSAEQGNAEAQNLYGWMLDEGLGTEINDGEAVRWYRRSADAGLAAGRYNIAMMIRNGEGVDANDALAKAHLDALSDADKQQVFEWYYRLATEANDPAAQSFIAEMFKDGYGTLPSSSESAKWERAAFDGKLALAHTGDVEAQLWVGREFLGQAFEKDGDAKAQAAQSARDWLQKAAEKKNSHAFLLLGHLELHAAGKDKKLRSRAIPFFLDAAEMGNPWAQLMLANCYSGGDTPEGQVDEGEALHWMTKAAEAGNSVAMLKLARWLWTGEVGEESKKESLVWYRQAAERGSASAQHMVGLTYALGNEVPHDPKQAVEWFTKAAGQNYAPAQAWLGLYLLRGKGVPQDAAQAVEWLNQAATQGHTDAQVLLSEAYATGNGVAKNVVHALKLRKAAAEKGDAEAQNLVALHYLNGEGVQKDAAKAVEWFTKAAEQDNVAAQFSLGASYYRGEGVVKDRAKAVKWWKKSAEKGHLLSCAWLGRAHAKGEGVKKNYGEAVRFFQRAADQDHSYSQRALGLAYAAGQGVPKNAATAVRWFKAAAANGDKQAQHLVRLHRLPPNLSLEML